MPPNIPTVTYPPGQSPSFKTVTGSQVQKMLNPLVANASAGPSSAAETTLWTSDFIPIEALIKGLTLDLEFGGTMSSNGSVDHTVTLQFIEQDGTVIDLLELVTVNAPNEDDKSFTCRYQARVHTSDSNTGKIVANGQLIMGWATPVIVAASTAVAGVTVDLLASTTITDANWGGRFRITDHMDGSDADSDMVVTTLKAQLLS